MQEMHCIEGGAYLNVISTFPVVFFHQIALKLILEIKTEHPHDSQLAVDILCVRGVILFQR